MSDLAQMSCVPCQGGEPVVQGEALKTLLGQLSEEWQVVEGHHLSREFRFDDFAEALDFTNIVGDLAEMAEHHPEIDLGWGRVVVDLWTHKINGLHKNDFILAAQIEQAHEQFQEELSDMLEAEDDDLELEDMDELEEFDDFEAEIEELEEFEINDELDEEDEDVDEDEEKPTHS